MIDLDNMRRVYRTVGAQMPGANVTEEEGYTACRSEIDHPIGNFALDLRLDPWVAGKLRNFACDMRAFRVVLGPDDFPEHAPELLRRAGFEPVQRLVSMIARSPLKGEGKIEPVRGPKSRLSVARFMTRTFFVREPEATQKAILEATAAIGEFDLFALRDRGRIQGAVAAFRTDGCLGLYNLCVASSRRNRGLGREMVKEVLTLAAEEGRAVVLQCDPSMEGWYSTLGFERSAALSIWAIR